MYGRRKLVKEKSSNKTKERTVISIHNYNIHNFVLVWQLEMMPPQWLTAVLRVQGHGCGLVLEPAPGFKPTAAVVVFLVNQAWLIPLVTAFSLRRLSLRFWPLLL